MGLLRSGQDRWAGFNYSIGSLQLQVMNGRARANRDLVAIILAQPRRNQSTNGSGAYQGYPGHDEYVTATESIGHGQIFANGLLFVQPIFNFGTMYG